MADERLRGLQRKRHDSPDDEAAYLVEAVRQGELSSARVAFAAWVGHGPAQRAVAQEAWSTRPPSEEREGWIRYAHASAQLSFEQCLHELPTKSRYVSPPRAALAACRAWIMAVGEAARERARAEAADVEDWFWSEPKNFGLSPQEEPAFYAVLHACCHAVGAVAFPAVQDPDEERAQAQEVVEINAYLRRRGRPLLPIPTPRASREQALAAYDAALNALQWVARHSREVAEGLLKKAFAASLVPWLLGERDPQSQPIAVRRDKSALLERAEAAAAADPTNLGTLKWLGNVCEDAGWTYQGKTLKEWTAEFLAPGAQNENLARNARDHLAKMGLKAAPAAMRALDEVPYLGPGGPEDRGISLLRELGPDGCVGIPALIAIARGDRYLMRRTAAIHALSGMGSRASDALPILVELLGDESVRNSAARALIGFGPSAIPFLHELLEGEDGTLTHLGGYLLVQLGQSHPRLQAALLHGLRDGNSEDRDRAVLGIACAGFGKQTVSELVAALERDDDHAVQRDILRLFGHMGVATEREDVRTAIRPLLDHEHPVIREAAEGALAGRDMIPEGGWRRPLDS